MNITTKFINRAQLLREIKAGQKLYIENFVKPELSRVAEVKNKYSYFFTVDKAGKESWIINGANEFKNIGIQFIPEREQVNLFWKADNKPYLSLYFNDIIIKGKESINA